MKNMTQADLAEKLNLIKEWDKTFKKSEKVNHKKVTFNNRYGITLVADMYEPKKYEGKLPAIAIAGPFGAVKEQCSGLYAQTMAERGFLTIAFDPSFTGESTGSLRYMASPDINTEDFQAAVDFLSVQDNVDIVGREKIMQIYIKVNNRTLTVLLEDNSSAKALVEKLKQKDITINMSDYGNFEKVGELGFSLPRNDRQITTEAGDLILYQGNSITIYYDTNSWNFTKLGRIINLTQNELKEILGKGDVTVTFSLEK